MLPYAQRKNRAERLAVALVEKIAPSNDDIFDYDLVLVVTAGALKGHVFAQHQASYDSTKGKLISDRFSCWK